MSVTVFQELQALKEKQLKIELEKGFDNLKAKRVIDGQEGINQLRQATNKNKKGQIQIKEFLTIFFIDEADVFDFPLDSNLPSFISALSNSQTG